jgi:hypothetical protein
LKARSDTPSVYNKLLRALRTGVSKETYLCQKRPIHGKQTYLCGKRNLNGCIQSNPFGFVFKTHIKKHG